MRIDSFLDAASSGYLKNCTGMFLALCGLFFSPTGRVGMAIFKM